MAIIPQAPGQGLVQQPAQSFIDTAPKGPIFGSELNEGRSSLDPVKDFTNHFARVHKKYKGMDTANIENLVNRLLQEKDSPLMNLVREETSLKDTFSNRLFKEKTPLGQVLQELQNSQESRNRKLLSKEVFRQAEKEAKELIHKRAISIGKIGSEFQINTNITRDQEDSSVAHLTNGKFIVAWASLNGNGNWEVHGQIFNADRTKNGSEFWVNTDSSVGHDPSVTSLSNGKFIVAWGGFDVSSYGIDGQVFNADGTKSGPSFQINTYTDSSQRSPSVASLSNDRFVVTWGSHGQNGYIYGIYGQLFNANGTKSGGEFQVNTYTE
ncbi:MAG: hypothetical protein K1060chlam4_01635, partial [Candidatus Anoxychlamydiales bacterium]|nr:hypothetical protein [Candidatus Anoxychlamydiales bacterium]